MAGKLPPFELCVVAHAVVSLDDEDLPGPFRMADPVPIPSGTICQVLKKDPPTSRSAEATIYYVDEVTGECEVERVPLGVLRPYDPQRDAETKQLERPGSDELPPRGPCT